HLATRRSGQFVAIGVLPSQAPRDVLASATFHKISGPVGGGYGLIVADQGPGPRDGHDQLGNYVVFEVGDKGEVGAWRREDDRWVDILGWTPNAAVRQGVGENTLTVRLTAGLAAFSVNNADIPLPQSVPTAAGGIGVFVGGDGNEAVLSRLTLTQLD